MSTSGETAQPITIEMVIARDDRGTGAIHVFLSKRRVLWKLVYASTSADGEPQGVGYDLHSFEEQTLGVLLASYRSHGPRGVFFFYFVRNPELHFEMPAVMALLYELRDLGKDPGAPGGAG